MMRIAILTATRAEYGLLFPIISRLNKDPEMDVRVVVTGMHLSPEFGMTYREIEADGVTIDKKIEMLINSDSPSSKTKSMGVAMIGFADYFSEIKPNALIVLGDRYETLAVCIAAMNERIPIIHIHGGEITEGAIDDAIRHSITKLSYIHLTSTEEYRRRVIQLGESPNRVFNVGALGVENSKSIPKMSREELELSLGWEFGENYAVLTYHPVTLEKDMEEKNINELLAAVSCFPKIRFVATKANADVGGKLINKKLEEYVAKNDNMKCYDSLGKIRYLNALRGAKFVIGNSSSGIIEMPSYKKPTINIGDRQKGRIMGDTVISCEAKKEPISEAIIKSLSVEFKGVCENSENVYGDGNTSDQIVSIIKNTDFGITHLKKGFHDIEFIE